MVIEPFRSFRDLICTIPGIGGFTADVVVAETGADMTKFPTAQHLASWAGTTPGNNESAGKVKSRRTRPGNPYLQGALGTAAMSISHTRDTYLDRMGGWGLLTSVALPARTHFLTATHVHMRVGPQPPIRSRWLVFFMANYFLPPKIAIFERVIWSAGR